MKKTQKQRKKSLLVQSRFRHVFIPHKANQFRPHLIRLHGITVVLVLAVVLQVVYGFTQTGQLAVLGRVSTIDTVQLLNLTNKAREDDSLNDLKINESLTRAAELKAQDMIANNYWSHTSPAGVTPWTWFHQVGYTYQVAGENLAKNYPTADATVAAWMASKTHRENILNTHYTEVGFAVAEGTLDGRDATVVVALYGQPAPAVQGETQTAPIITAPETGSIGNPLVYVGSALQSLSPASLGTLALLTVVGGVALLTHQYRSKLPVAWRKSWKAHHGLYTVVGVIGLAAIVILATGGGQI